MGEVTKKDGESFVVLNKKKARSRREIGQKLEYRILQLLHAYVAKLHTLAVTAEADVTLLVEQTGVVVTIHSVGVLAAV